MRCLYCGKHLALFRKLTGGGEFCSDSHRDKYHEEYNRLAVSRLLQAQARPEEAKKAVKKKAGTHPPPAPAPPVVTAVEVAPEPEPELELQEVNRLEELPAPEFTPEPDEPELVEYVREFQLQPVMPVAVAAEWLPIETEPVFAADIPVLSSLLENSRPVVRVAAFEFDGGGDFLIDYPASRQCVMAPLDTAAPLVAEATPDLRTNLDVHLNAALAEAEALTDSFVPGACACEFEPVTVSVAPTEFTAPRPVVSLVLKMNGFTSTAPEPGLAGPKTLTLVSLPIEDGAVEIVESLEFASLYEFQSSFDSSLKQLNMEDELEDEPPVIEPVAAEAAADEIPASEIAVQPLNGMHVPNAEPAEVTPRKVLEVLSKIHAGEVGSPAVADKPVVPAKPALPDKVAVAEKVEAPAPVPEVNEPEVPTRGVLRTLTIPALIPSSAALMSGFPALPVGIQPRPLPYSPLPLRPKMAVGNALGPRAARNGGQNGSAARKAPDASKTMPRSMLHLEVADTENEVETPTLLGRLGGLFGKKHKNH